MDIIQSIKLKTAFGDYFTDLGTWGAWQTYLRALFAIKPAAGDLELLKKCTGLGSWPEKPARESYVIVSRRGGKTSIAALLASYMALFKDWSPYLSKGERGSIFLLAVNKSQARILKERIEGFLSLNHTGSIKKIMQEEIELTNGISIVIKPGSFRSLRGYTVVCAILEELSFWRYELEAANQDVEVLRALRPALGTVPGSLLVGISSPYGKGGLMYEKFQKWHGKAGGPLVWKASTRTMNPTFSAEEVKQALAEDPDAAAAEYGGEFRPDQSSFADPETIDAAVIPGRFELAFQDGREYQGFVDPSGGKSDSFTLSIAHRDGGRILLDLIREQAPPFSPDSVAGDFSRELKKYKISTVETDRYAGEWVKESFQKNGIGIDYSERSKAEIYLEFLPILNNGTAELLDHGRLIGQLKNLDRRTRAGGKDLVDCFQGHDDVINAAAGAMVACQDPGEVGTVWTPGDPVEIDALEEDFDNDFDIGWVGSPDNESIRGGLGMESKVTPADGFWMAWLNERRFGGRDSSNIFAAAHRAYGQAILKMIEGRNIFYEKDIAALAGQLEAHKGAPYKAVSPCIVEFWLNQFGYSHFKMLGSWELKGPLRLPPGIEYHGLDYSLFDMGQLRAMAKKAGIKFTEQSERADLIKVLTDNA